MPLPLAAIPPIVTAVGRFAVPYLVKELGKIGTNKFVQTYGNEAFTGLNEALIKNTTMLNPEAMPMINPSFKAPGVIAPDAEEMEREAEKIREMTKPIGFPADPPIKPDIKTGDTTPPKIDTTEQFPLEDKPLPKTPGFGEGDKIDIPIITSMKDGKSEFKYPTEEEIKEYINEENEFWKQNIQQIKEKNPDFSVENMPQVVDADKHFGAAAYTFQNYDDSKLIYMSPDEYLSLTKEYRSEEGKETLGSKMNIKNLENILREGGELANIPTLYIKKPFEDLDTFEVIGQEGNHRAKAFKNLGYDKIPVVIEGSTREIRKKTKDVFPTSIISYSNYNKDKKEYEQYDSVSTKPTDFYNVLTKEKLVKADDVSAQTEKLVRGIGDNNPPSPIDDINDQTEKLLDKKDTKELTTQNFLDDKLMDELLVMRGGIKGFKERMSGPMAPMPASTKAKMEMELQNKLFAKYKINEYPEGETPETVTKERQDYLIHTYNKRLAAIEYITSVAYDVIGTKDKDSLLVVDEDGLPLAGAKIAIPGSGRINQSDVFSKDALVIVEAGSVFREAGDQLFNDIIQKAKDEGKKYVVAEDLTSEGALQAMKDRGFRTPTTKDTKKFKGKKIRRPNGRSAVQKNLVYIIK